MKSRFTLLSLSSHISYLPVANCAKPCIAYALPPFDSSPKMTTAVLPSTPANWLYLESDCDGLSSNQVQTYSILTHLMWTTDVNVTRYWSCSVRRWFGEKPSATITEKTNCIYEMNVAQNITDILLLSLVTELWVRFWWSSYLQISFEPPMSTLQGIDHAPYVVGSVRIQAQQLLRRRTACTRWMWHKT